MLISWLGRIVILFVGLLAMTGVYVAYRVLVFRKKPHKTLDVIVAALDSIGAFDERTITTNQTTVTYKANRQFARHFTEADSNEDFEKTQEVLFNALEDKLREALAADPGADLSKYETAFGIDILSVTSDKTP